MTVKIEKFNVSTNGFSDFIDITSKLQNIVNCANIKDAILNVSILSSTASVLTLEQEPGLSTDLSDLLESIAPLNKILNHDAIWHEGNGAAHLKAALLKNNITLCVKDGKIELSKYQQIVAVDFDTKPSVKTIVAAIVY